MTFEIALSKLSLPSGRIAKIEEATRELSPKFPPSTWLNESLLQLLLHSHPIRVRRSRKECEVVGGFRVWHLARVVSSPAKQIHVQEVTGKEPRLVEQAMMELVAPVLMGPLGNVAERRRLYQVLRQLVQSIKTDPDIQVPEILSPRNLRMILNITSEQAARPRARESSYIKQLEGAK